DTAKISYSSYGTYNILFITETNFGCRDSAEYEVHVVANPEARIIIDDTIQCLEGNNFVFHNGTTSADPNQKVTSEWDFSDGNFAVDTVKGDVSNKYYYQGDYTVSLIVTTIT